MHTALAGGVDVDVSTSQLGRRAWKGPRPVQAFDEPQSIRCGPPVEPSAWQPLSDQNRRGSPRAHFE